MPEKYMLYPTTVVVLASEINKVVDDYTARKISSDELYDVILAWAHNVPDKLFDIEGENGYNKTIRLKVGKKRLLIIDKMLERYMDRLNEEK